MPEDNQVKLARKMIDAGADAVIGAHPHIPQTVDWYRGKPIVYSLGNFVFNYLPARPAGLFRLDRAIDDRQGRPRRDEDHGREDRTDRPAAIRNAGRYDQLMKKNIGGTRFARPTLLARSWWDPTSLPSPRGNLD